MSGAPDALLRARLQPCHLVHVWPPASAAEVKSGWGVGGGVGIEFRCGGEGDSVALEAFGLDVTAEVESPLRGVPPPGGWGS